MLTEAKETIVADGITYNLHIFGGPDNPRSHQASLEYYSEEDGGVYADCCIWIEAGEVVDYDGCYALPPVAVAWLRARGIKVPATCTYTND